MRTRVKICGITRVQDAQAACDAAAQAQGYSIDSRTLVPGELFFAVQGERLDGHDFVEAARGAGAVVPVAAVTDALVCLGVLSRRGSSLAVPDELRPAFDPSSPTSATNAMDHHWFVLQRWARLDSVLATGEPLPRPREDATRRRAFILAMPDMARRSAPALWEAADLRHATHLVDVGGGPGELSLAALERFPALQATVFDLPDVLAIAREYASKRDVA